MIWLFIGYAIMFAMMIGTFRANVRIIKAVSALYYAGHWTSLTVLPADQVRLWTDLRDACCLEPGKAPKP